MILVIYAHPYPQHSRACKAMLHAARDLPDLEVRSLYAGRDELAEQFARDRKQLEKEHSSKGWHRDDMEK